MLNLKLISFNMQKTLDGLHIPAKETLLNVFKNLDKGSDQSRNHLIDILRKMGVPMAKPHIDKEIKSGKINGIIIKYFFEEIRPVVLNSFSTLSTEKSLAPILEIIDLLCLEKQETAMTAKKALIYLANFIMQETKSDEVKDYINSLIKENITPSNPQIKSREDILRHLTWDVDRKKEILDHLFALADHTIFHEIKISLEKNAEELTVLIESSKEISWDKICEIKNVEISFDEDKNTIKIRVKRGK